MRYQVSREQIEYYQTCVYMPDGDNFNDQKNILPDEYVQILKVGDPLNNDVQSPLIYHASIPEVI